MKLFLALMASLLIHTFFMQWKTDSDLEIIGSAGQAVLNIQQMRFITTSAEPVTETKTDISAIEDVIEEPISKMEPVIQVEKEQFEKPKEVIAKLEKKKTPQLEVIKKEEVKQVEKPVKTNTDKDKDKDKEENKPVEKQYVETVIDNKKEVIAETEAEIETELDIETELEMTDIDEAPEETEVVVEQSETTAIEVVSTTDVISENTGFDQIPTMEEPRYRKAFPPDYPRLAKRRGQEGLVLLRAKVDKQGEVEMVEVLASSGVKSLDTRALETVEQWQFYPYTIANEATEAWVNIPVAFTLK